MSSVDQTALISVDADHCTFLLVDIDQCSFMNPQTHHRHQEPMHHPHARLSLHINQNPNPIPAVQYGMVLDDTAAIELFFHLSD